MISAFSFVLLAQLPLGPIPQPGGNRLHHELVNNVAQALKASDWKKAEIAARALPKKEITIEWNDADVPAAYRSQFREAREAFAKEFLAQSVEWSIKYGTKGDVRIGFVPELPIRDGGLRPAAALMFSPNPDEPRVESVIALKRGAPLVPTTPDDVYNELGFAVLQFLGKEPTPYPADFSYRSEQPSTSRRKLSVYERLFIQRSGRNYDSLRESVRLQKAIEPAIPSAHIDIKMVDLVPAVQGDVRNFNLPITNNGNAVLLVNARPDCGCVFVEPAQTIEPGQTIMLKAGIDTTEFVGQLDKKIFVTTNDPAKPIITIPVRIYAKPLYRIIHLPGVNVVSEGGAPFSTDLYVSIDPSIKMKATSVETTGLPSTAKLEPWSGSLADPEMNEPAKARKGYRVRVNVAKGLGNGRFPVSVMVNTDSAKYPVLRYTFYVQTGITALPSVVFFGDIKREPRSGSTFLTRPGKPFKITKVVPGAKFVKASVVETKPGVEYRLQIQLDGTQPFGSLSELVNVYTDDPKQKVISVNVSANVK